MKPPSTGKLVPIMLLNEQSPDFHALKTHEKGIKGMGWKLTNTRENMLKVCSESIFTFGKTCVCKSNFAI